MRDLFKDKKMCEHTYPGPWSVVGDTISTTKTDKDGWHTAIVYPRTPRPSRETMHFIAEARQALPYWIAQYEAAQARISELETLAEQQGSALILMRNRLRELEGTTV